jgi:hypothetical protein
MSLLQREKDSLLSGMKQKLVWSVSAQMVLFPLMKTGKLDHFGPLVSVMGARQGGKYTFGGSNCSVNGMTVSFDLTKSSERHYVWAKILSLPAWYPRWVGEVPIEIRLNGALLEAVPTPESKPPKEPLRQNRANREARNKARRKH